MKIITPNMLNLPDLGNHLHQIRKLLYELSTKALEIRMEINFLDIDACQRHAQR